MDDVTKALNLVPMVVEQTSRGSVLTTYIRVY